MATREIMDSSLEAVVDDVVDEKRRLRARSISSDSSE
jgi:diacylglycerol kinase